MDAEFKVIKNQIQLKQHLNALTNKILIDAAQINVKDIKKGLDQGKGPKGKFQKLRAQTVKKKAIKGYKTPSKPLIATGMMRRLPPIKISDNKVTISVARKRGKIAQYHDQGGSTGKNPPKRPWFDIYPETIKKVNRLIKKRLVKLYARL